MMTAYKTNPELKAKLKEPFGELFRGSFVENIERIRAIVKQEKPPRTISVGDTVSINLRKHNVSPQLSITDNRCMRKPTKPRSFKVERIIRIKNPKGTITQEAITAIEGTMESKERAHIIVTGEEDLLTLIAVLYAPEKSLVVYGQPHEGIVVVKVTPEKKAEAKEILEGMKMVRNTK